MHIRVELHRTGPHIGSSSIAFATTGTTLSACPSVHIPSQAPRDVPLKEATGSLVPAPRPGLEYRFCLKFDRPKVILHETVVRQLAKLDQNRILPVEVRNNAAGRPRGASCWSRRYTSGYSDAVGRKQGITSMVLLC